MTTAELARVLRAGALHAYGNATWPSREPVTMVDLARTLEAMVTEATKITQEKGE